jgi:glycosyltransferase involved in cell wall biosynthesis
VRIALIGPAHPYKGGGARHTTELAHRLAAAGHDVIIESWRAQYPRRLYPGQQTVDVPEGEPYPRTYRRLAWYRPDGWLAAGRRLRSADLVVFVLLTPLQVPAYLAVLAGLGGRPGRPRTAVICHNVLPHERRPGDVALTRALLSHVDTVLTHSAGQAAQARELAPGAPVRTVTMPPHLPTAARQNHRTERTSVSAHAQCRLLFFGIVRPYKGLDVLLRALARAPAHVTLTVAGEFWGGTGETERLIAGLGIGDRVSLRPGAVRGGGRAGHAVPGGDRLAERATGVRAWRAGDHHDGRRAGGGGARRRGRADLCAGRRRGPAPRADPDQRSADGPPAPRRDTGCGSGAGLG